MRWLRAMKHAIHLFFSVYNTALLAHPPRTAETSVVHRAFSCFRIPADKIQIEIQSARVHTRCHTSVESRVLCPVVQMRNIGTHKPTQRLRTQTEPQGTAHRTAFGMQMHTGLTHHRCSLDWCFTDTQHSMITLRLRLHTRDAALPHSQTLIERMMRHATLCREPALSACM